MTDFDSVSGGGSGPEDVRDDLNKLRADLGKLSDAVAQLVREQAAEQAGRVREAVDTARGQVTDAAGSFARAGSGLAEDAQARLQTLGTELEDSVRRSPMTALLVAGITGMILGMMTSR